MKKEFHDESVCQENSHDGGQQVGNTAKSSLSDFSKALLGSKDTIRKALNSMSLHCPGCKKNHIGEGHIGKVGTWLGGGETPLEDRVYFICKRCAHKSGSQTFTHRIERRLLKSPYQYGMGLLSSRAAEKAGIDPLHVVNGGCSTTDPWVLDDSVWFDAHPDRLHRVRRIFSEAEAEFYKRTDGRTYEGERLVGVGVQQIEPGSRIRKKLYVDENMSDAEAGAIIDRMNASEDKASRSMMAAIQTRQGKQIQAADIIPSAGIGRPS